MIWFKRFLTACAALSLLLVIGFFTLAPQWVDRNANVVTGGAGPAPSAGTLALHQQLLVGDLHADSALWGRDLLTRHRWGQVDLPRLIEGGAALQMFTTVTKSPRGQNYDRNASDAADNIRCLRWHSVGRQRPTIAFSPARCCKLSGC